ncbi:dicarboxylate/amino acid:cation symporter [Spiroplasma endosymbiont of Virgichneumon dumeticola]|uniref:dicarboxylate/amino acid:cation symporter n=1 Tax=Spiroplasma endosymbiont of Virgichneumon dumeticola TaxID=3139323 RepID=UPI0035C9398D
MNTLASNNINLLRDFIGISHWQSLVAIIIFFGAIICLSIFIRKVKPKFPIRIFIGMTLGLTFAIVIQAITGFKSNKISNHGDATNPNPYYIEWVGQIACWIELLRNIFITGITMLTIPLVFLAIARITSKKNSNSKTIAKVSGIGITILLVNVAIAFCIAFGLGIFFKIGQGFDLSGSGTYDKTAAKTIPEIIVSYIPSSLIGVFTQALIMPLIVLGALIGFAIKKLTKHNEERMDKVRHSLETMWKIVISILMMFIKIMPFAVMSMLAAAIINQPIGALANIGIIIGVAYLALLLTFLWHLLSLYLFGINPYRWLAKAQRPIIAGFTSQSSNAALPIAMTTLKEDLKIKDEGADTVMPLSTTIGLSGCAGVQAGIILSFLWFSVIIPGNFSNWTIAILFINGIFVTLVASLGIAGVPGTAAVMTAGVLGGLGFGGFYLPVYGVIGALDGLFDMGRTAVNISGGLQATVIASRNQDLIDDEKLLLKRYPFKPFHMFTKKVGAKLIFRNDKINQIQTLKRDTKIKIEVLKKTKNSENDIKFLKTQLKSQIKDIKNQKEQSK